MRLADYVADFFVRHGIDDLFCVVGGGSMYLNDAFGHTDGMRVTYVQHEQAATMAAEGWARIKGTPCGVCVTTGPGGVNALNGVLGAWLDNIPMFVVSGQVRSDITVKSTGLQLKQYGEQEFPIADLARSMSKYVAELEQPDDIRYQLERAFWECTNGRRGPVWLDIPMDYQNADIQPEALRGFVPARVAYDLKIDEVIECLRRARRPILVGGSGIRSSCSLDAFRSLAHHLDIPVLCSASVTDVLPWSDSTYFGNFGSNGGRTGNYMVQNADLIIILGSSMAFRNTGFAFESFAPKATIISVNVSDDDLRKPNLHVDLPIVADLKQFIPALEQATASAGYGTREWREWCEDLRARFPMYVSRYADCKLVNQYEFYHQLLSVLPDDAIIVEGSSCASVGGLTMGTNACNQRNFGNINNGSMGWALPAAVGACRAAENAQVWACDGDGGMQMNIQELQTIRFNNLPIKIVVFSNGGYQACFTSQQMAFGRLNGCRADCGLGMPNYERLAWAYELPYVRISNNHEISDALRRCNDIAGPVLLEVMQDPTQGIEPRLTSRRLTDGSIASPTLTCLSPQVDERDFKTEW